MANTCAHTHTHTHTHKHTHTTTYIHTYMHACIVCTYVRDACTNVQYCDWLVWPGFLVTLTFGLGDINFINCHSVNFITKFGNPTTMRGFFIFVRILWTNWDLWKFVPKSVTSLRLISFRGTLGTLSRDTICVLRQYFANVASTTPANFFVP